MELLGIILSLTLIIFTLRRGWPMWASMLTGSLVVTVFARLSPAAALAVLGASLSNETTLRLLLLVFLITILAAILYETKGLEYMVRDLRAMFAGVRFLVIGLPALVGILGFPGGAIFSAPLVDSTGSLVPMTRIKKALANVFYRHLSYMVNPLNSAIILLSELTGFSIFYFVRFNMATFLVALLFSYWYIFVFQRNQEIDPLDLTPIAAAAIAPPDRERPFADRCKALLQSFAPFLVIIILAAIPGVPLPWALVGGNMLAVVNYLPAEKRGAALWARLKQALPSANWALVFSVASVMVFKDFVLATSVIDELAGVLVRSSIPVMLLAALLPYLIGMITGNPWAIIAMSVPVLLPLLPAGMEGPYLGVILSSSLIGYLNSPLHLCLLLTNDYFKVTLGETVFPLHLLSSVMLAGAVATAFVLIIF